MKSVAEGLAFSGILLKCSSICSCYTCVELYGKQGTIKGVSLQVLGEIRFYKTIEFIVAVMIT